MSTTDAPPVRASDVFTEPTVVALADAIARGEQAEVRRLAPEADLSARGDKRITLLQWALMHQQPDCMRILLEAGADIAQPGLDGDTALHTAAMSNDPAYLRLLLAAGANPDLPNGETGAPPLRNALMGERTEQFHALLAAGADPDRSDRTGNTPLHVAAQVNEPALALELLQAGADPMARNAQGATFQRYLFMTRSALLSADARRQREAVEAWLSAHRIPLEASR